MEKIKINDMQTKGVVFIVKYVRTDSKPEVNEPPKEATMNTNFNKQEIWYPENEVGLGGTVDVEITSKPKNPTDPSKGFWVNITKVDFTSAVKGATSDHHNPDKNGVYPTGNVPQSPVNVPKEERFRTPNEMVATELTVALIGISGGCDNIMDAVEMYKGCLRLLDE